MPRRITFHCPQCTRGELVRRPSRPDDKMILFDCSRCRATLPALAKFCALVDEYNDAVAADERREVERRLLRRR